jgi:hypothetical protein
MLQRISKAQDQIVRAEYNWLRIGFNVVVRLKIPQVEFLIHLSGCQQLLQGINYLVILYSRDHAMGHCLILTYLPYIL